MSIDSIGNSEFVAKFNSHYMLDALQAMTGDKVTIHYKMEELSIVVARHAVLLQNIIMHLHSEKIRKLRL